MTDDDEQLPRDPDWDDVPEELTLLSGLGPVTVLDEDGVCDDLVVIAPGLFGHARRLDEG
jgi:hypothetical protein